jgi:superfamily II DNA helicase RecQ
MLVSIVNKGNHSCLKSLSSASFVESSFRMTQASFLTLIAPPASGKTYWIESFVRELAAKSVLIVSPLRALANECQDKWQGRIPIVTPEEWLLKTENGSAEIVIFDEFHLYLHWGDSFRPKMWEAFYGLASQARLVIVLTATMSPEMKKLLESFSLFYTQNILCDFGNRRLLHQPTLYRKAPDRTFIENLILMGPRGPGVNLVFCQYRQEVFAWEQKLKKLGFRVWSCVGGEAKLMQQKMREEEVPDFIVATTVLSHGVNLPRISCIFFLYALHDVDFWIQMVARGGRRGEGYEVFAMENPHGIKWNRWTNFLAILVIGFKMKLHQYWSQIEEWFLKASP